MDHKAINILNCYFFVLTCVICVHGQFRCPVTRAINFVHLVKILYNKDFNCSFWSFQNIKWSIILLDQWSKSFVLSPSWFYFFVFLIVEFFLGQYVYALRSLSPQSIARYDTISTNTPRCKHETQETFRFAD